jgi:peptidoglycan/LPS O-acetylase OafA/YrhL
VFHVWDSANTSTRGSHGLNFGSLGPVLDNLRGGVALFFVLSGFLLYRPWANAVAARKVRPSTRVYARNRALRILPLYWTIMLVLVLTVQRGLLDRPAQAIGDFFFLQNSVPGWEPVDGFSGFGISPAWSLCVEVVFYVSLPLLGWIAYKNRNAWTPVIGMALLGIAAKIAGGVAGLGAVWSMSFPVHADWFACGMAVACLHVTRERLPRRVLLAGAVLVGLAATKIQSVGLLGFTDAQSLMAVASAMLLAVVVFSPGRARLVRLLETRPLLTAGVWSYGIFLWQVPVIAYVRDHGLTRPGAGGFAFNLLLVAAVTVALSAVTYRLVDAPALRWKKRASPAVPHRGGFAAPPTMTADTHAAPVRGRDSQPTVVTVALSEPVEPPPTPVVVEPM